MEWLRIRKGKSERCWLSDNAEPDKLSAALSLLSNTVVLVSHPYLRHSNSGSGNCWCGRDKSNSIHDVTSVHFGGPDATS